MSPQIKQTIEVLESILTAYSNIHFKKTMNKEIIALSQVIEMLKRVDMEKVYLKFHNCFIDKGIAQEIVDYLEAK